MDSRKSLLLAGIALTAGLSGIHAAHAGAFCYRQAPDRGLAILSPLESPDPCDSPVGGCYRYTPYYPGYALDRRCMVIYGHQPWDFGSVAPQNRTTDYGTYTGASRDEATLLRLGGNGGAARGTYRPYPGNGDMINQDARALKQRKL